MRTLFFLLSALLLGGALLAPASEVKMQGLRFPVGGRPDAPAARVKIEQVGQGAQKLGFFRVSILPQVVVHGMEIRLRGEDIGSLKEIPKTLAALAKCDALEFQKIAVFLADERIPRLLAERASPDKETWALKRVRIKTSLGFRELREATLHLGATSAGTCTSPDADAPLRLDLKADPPRP